MGTILSTSGPPLKYHQGQVIKKEQLLSITLNDSRPLERGPYKVSFRFLIVFVFVVRCYFWLCTQG